MPQAPIININGTSPDALVEQVIDILTALREAKMMLVKHGPHGRDYQTDPSGGILFRLAQSEHRSRLIHLDAMIKDYEDIGEQIMAQREGRKRYRFHVVCPKCNETTDVISDRRVPDPEVKCGGCLMDRVEVVAMKVVKVEEVR